jgi:hypothetical protein
MENNDARQAGTENDGRNANAKLMSHHLTSFTHMCPDSISVLILSVSLVLIDTTKQFNAAGYSTTGQRGEVMPSQASK